MGVAKSAYVIVGLFVVLMIGALLVVIVRLSGWAADYDRYYTVFHNVGGIKDGTKVYYEGFPVGQVVAVRPVTEEERREAAPLAMGPMRTMFRLDLQVQKGWPIPRNAEARISTPGFLAGKIITITERPVPEGVVVGVVQPGGFVRSRPPEGFAALLNRGTSLADRAEDLIRTAQNSITEQVNPTLVQARVTLQNLDKRFDTLSGQAETLLTEANRFALNVNKVVDEDNRAQVKAILANVDAASTDLNRFTGKMNAVADTADGMLRENRENLKQSIVSLRYVLDAMAGRVDSVTRNLETTSRNMVEFSRQIRNNPGVLLGGTGGGRRR